MRNISIAWIIILITTMFCSGAFGEDAEIDMRAELNNIQDIPQVYYEYGSSAKADKNEVSRLVEKFNAYTNTELQAGDYDTSRPFISNGREYFEMYNTLSKAFIWSKDINEYINQSDTEKLPGKSVAAVFAKEHLMKLNLLPGAQNEMIVEHVGSSVLSFYNPETKAVENYEKLRNVYFTRVLHGCRVVGGMRIVVQMGTDGELVSLINNWPGLSEKKIKKSPKQNALFLKEKSKVFLQKHYRGSKVKSVIVDSGTLVMYDDGNGIVEPALLVKGKAMNSNGAFHDGDWILPVLDNPKAAYTVLNEKSASGEVWRDVIPLEEKQEEKDDELAHEVE
ncbi:MAG: hypothetical protein JXB88_15935 [Spirochaetales bacterium]|nr:hypothetical protein [Spirochaetales bacterium]